MGHPAGLARLALPARDEPIPPSVRPIRNAVAAAPELRRNSIVDDITNHVAAFAVLDEPKCVATELEVIPSLIDAVGPVAFDVDTSFHVGEQFVEGSDTRFKSNISDAHDRDAVPAVSPIGAARARFADFRRDLTVGAVADENPVAHNVPLLTGHAVVVI